jgi:hypothetical protein
MERKMDIFEHLEKIDEIIEKKFGIEAQNMMQILEVGYLGGLGFSTAGMRPLSQSYKDLYGNAIDHDFDDISDDIDYQFGHGQYSPNDQSHNGIPDNLEE